VGKEHRKDYILRVKKPIGIKNVLDMMKNRNKIYRKIITLTQKLTIHERKTLINELYIDLYFDLYDQHTPINH